MKKSHKYWMIGIMGGVFLSLGFLAYYQNGNKVTFSWNGVESKEGEVIVVHGQDFSFAPADLKLTAANHWEDVSNQITYEPIAFKELKTYEIPYVVQAKGKEYTFLLSVIFKDETAPLFHGPQALTLMNGEEFSLSPKDHEIYAEDAFEGDVSEHIEVSGEVDTNTAGTYEITYSVSDSSNNTSTYVVRVEVQDKEPQGSTYENNSNVYDDPRDITPAIIDPQSMQVLVNKTHAIPDGWAPDDLVSIRSNNGQAMYLRSEAAVAWEQLNDAAQAQGIQIAVVSSYRTAAYQANLFNNYYAADGADAFLYSALPRRSEHELGLAVDVSYDGQLHSDLLNTDVGQFMNNEGYQYGFILRYPQDKVTITGYGFEAWHYRYVGVGMATELKNRGIVMEEY